jgi:hypothetical protein
MEDCITLPQLAHNALELAAKAHHSLDKEDLDKALTALTETMNEFLKIIPNYAPPNFLRAAMGIGRTMQIVAQRDEAELNNRYAALEAEARTTFAVKSSFRYHTPRTLFCGPFATKEEAKRFCNMPESNVVEIFPLQPAHLDALFIGPFSSLASTASYIAALQDRGGYELFELHRPDHNCLASPP